MELVAKDETGGPLVGLGGEWKGAAPDYVTEAPTPRDDLTKKREQRAWEQATEPPQRSRNDTPSPPPS